MLEISEQPQQPVELERPWYKQFWPWFLMALPASVVVAGIGTLILAIRTPLSLVEEDYYKQGLGINEDIAAREYAMSLNPGANILLSGKLIQVDLDKPVAEQLELRLIHATDSQRDMHFQLHKTGQRRFQLNAEENQVARLLNESYRIRLIGRFNDQVWVISQERLSTPSSDPIHISIAARQDRTDG